MVNVKRKINQTKAQINVLSINLMKLKMVKLI